MPSPTLLKPNTRITIAIPGASDIHGSVASHARPWFVMEPHAGVGGARPRPIKLKPASAITPPPRPIVIVTIIGEMQFGRMCLNIMRNLESPMARLAVI
jgi:hypothetical protein